MSIRNGMPAADLPEVTWRKSRRSGPQGGNCVEVADLPDGQVAMRNSRHPAGRPWCSPRPSGPPSSAAPGMATSIKPDAQRAVDPPGPPPLLP